MFYDAAIFFSPPRLLCLLEAKAVKYMRSPPFSVSPKVPSSCWDFPILFEDFYWIKIEPHWTIENSGHYAFQRDASKERMISITVSLESSTPVNERILPIVPLSTLHIRQNMVQAGTFPLSPEAYSDGYTLSQKV